jgi:hypothetical protein
MSAKTLLRELIRELRLTNHSHNSLWESPAYQFISKNFRRNQVTAEQTCKAQQESKYMADTYLCYLKSSRKAASLIQEFHGQGLTQLLKTKLYTKQFMLFLFQVNAQCVARLTWLDSNYPMIPNRLCIPM